MRNIQFDTALIILVIYLLLSAAGWMVLKTTFGHQRSFRIISRIYWILSLLQSLFFIILFIYPFNTATTTRYGLYFVYNSILIADIFSRVPLLFAAFTALFLKRNSRFKYAISMGGIMITSGLILTFVWGYTIGPRSLKAEYVELRFNNLPDAFDGFKITQISDLHLGNFHYRDMFKRAARKSNEFKPDLLLFTGDLVNNFSRETDNWQTAFLQFDAPHKYAVAGNHDYGDYYRWPDQKQKADNEAGIRNAFQEFGFNILSNSAAPIVANNDTIYITGVENWGHPPFPQYADLDKATEGIPENAFKILMTHDPAHWQSVVRYRENFPLSLSGHSHGFQWGIKLAGIEFSLIWFSRQNWAGLYEYRGNFLYVNRGLGTIGIPLRIDMPAEITFFTLRKR